MFWFKKKKNDEDKREELAEHVSVTIAQHNLVKYQAVAEAKHAQDDLKQIINHNGFTLKIHIAAGGKQH